MGIKPSSLRSTPNMKWPRLATFLPCAASLYAPKPLHSFSSCKQNLAAPRLTHLILFRQHSACALTATTLSNYAIPISPLNSPHLLTWLSHNSNREIICFGSQVGRGSALSQHLLQLAPEGLLHHVQLLPQSRACLSSLHLLFSASVVQVPLPVGCNNSALSYLALFRLQCLPLIFDVWPNWFFWKSTFHLSN